MRGYDLTHQRRGWELVPPRLGNVAQFGRAWKGKGCMQPMRNQCQWFKSTHSHQGFSVQQAPYCLGVSHGKTMQENRRFQVLIARRTTKGEAGKGVQRIPQRDSGPVRPSGVI